MACVAAVVAVLVSGFLHGDPTHHVPVPGRQSSRLRSRTAKARQSLRGRWTRHRRDMRRRTHRWPRRRRPAVTSDSYKFLATNDDGTPVGYSPCRPLHYVVNNATAPVGSDELLATAIANVSAASGIQFVNDGTTDELPVERREPYQPSKYGERWAPLLISWTTPEAAPALADKVIGTGGSTMYSLNKGPKSYITGSLELDTPQVY
jgi:hypothetical protein